MVGDFFLVTEVAVTVFAEIVLEVLDVDGLIGVMAVFEDGAKETFV